MLGLIASKERLEGDEMTDFSAGDTAMGVAERIRLGGAVSYLLWGEIRWRAFSLRVPALQLLVQL